MHIHIRCKFYQYGHVLDFNVHAGVLHCSACLNSCLGFSSSDIPVGLDDGVSVQKVQGVFSISVYGVHWCSQATDCLAQRVYSCFLCNAQTKACTANIYSRLHCNAYAHALQARRTRVTATLVVLSGFSVRPVQGLTSSAEKRRHRARFVAVYRRLSELPMPVGCALRPLSPLWISA